jgi:hypothetical protein
LEVKDRVPTLSFKSFDAFLAGAAQRAELVGDTGPSEPRNWTGGFGTGSDHVLVTLHAESAEVLTSYSDRLTSLFAECNAFREIWRRDGMALTETKDGKPVFTSKVHFGYTDGIRRTTIRGGPEKYPPDHQEPCEPWLFVVLDESENYLVPEPRELGLNGCFAVFKMIRTDVVGFENFLQSNKDKIDPELLAAKMCGRWRNGVPLALSPDTDSPPGGISPEQLNNLLSQWVNDGEFVGAVRLHFDGSGRVLLPAELSVLRAILLAQLQSRQPIKPYQQLRYWSTVLFRHGPVDVVKQSATPSRANPSRPLQRKDADALQDELIRHLEEDSTMSSFDFGLQFLDTEKMTYAGKRRDASFWIENASIEWREEQAPFHTVARLTLISKSQLTLHAGDATYIDVTGNAAPDSVPVGSINRARRHGEVTSRRARAGVDDGHELPSSEFLR